MYIFKIYFWIWFCSCSYCVIHITTMQGSRTNWPSQYQNVHPFWVLLRQVTMEVVLVVTGTVKFKSSTSSSSEIATGCMPCFFSRPDTLLVTQSAVTKCSNTVWLLFRLWNDLVVKVKVKEVDLYSAFIEVPYTQGAQVRITQCYLQTTPYLPLPCKHSPDGASQTAVADI